MKTKAQIHQSKMEDKRRRQIRNGIALENDAVVPVYINYKEPLRAVEGGFGFMGVLASNEAKTHVQCHICGLYFGRLTQHLRAHQITSNEYKDKFGLMRKTALISDSYREGRIKVYNSQPELHIKTMANFAKRIKNADRNHDNLRTPWRLERRNIEGNCPDQLLDKINKLAREMGKTPTVHDFKDEYGSRYIGAIKATFGSYNKAILVAGFKPNPVGGRTLYTRQLLLEYLKQFFLEHHRVPVSSDFSRGYLPSRGVYRDWFSTLNDARKEAGIPILIPMGGHRYMEVFANDPTT